MDAMILVILVSLWFIWVGGGEMVFAVFASWR
jgi:hypothetical protein